MKSRTLWCTPDVETQDDRGWWWWWWWEENKVIDRANRLSR